MPDTRPEPPPISGAADVAVIAAGDPGATGLTSRLAVEVVVHQLRLRRPELRIEARAPQAGTPLDFDGEPAAVGGRVPFVIICAGPADRLAGRLLDRYADEGATAEVLPLGSPGGDPLDLCDRLLGAAERERHLDILRLSHRVPNEGPYLVEVLRDAPAGTDIGVESLAFRLDASLYSPSSDDTPLDLVAAVAGSALVVSDDPQILSVATALGRPILVIDPDRQALLGQRLVPTARMVRHPDELLAMTDLPPAPEPADRHGRQDAADQLLDALADRLIPASGPPALPDLVAVLLERVRALEATNAALRARLHAARRAAPHSEPPGRTGESAELTTLRLAVAEAEADRRRLQGELDRVYATRTMKLVAPARRIYGRLRSGGG